MVYVMRSLPPFVLALSLFQMAYPEILLNGALSAVAILIQILLRLTLQDDLCGTPHPVS